MIRNFLKVTFRNMVRNKLFTSINILGMSVSLACCMLLFSYVSQEMNYDSHHGGDIFRLTSELTQLEGEAFIIGTSSVPIAPVIENDIPEINRAVRVTGGGFLSAKDLITYEDDSYYIEDGYVADPALFKVLKYDLISGDPENPLPFSNAVILSKTWATKLFGDQQAMGQMLKISTVMGLADYEVTGVFDNETYTSHLNPSYFISTENANWKGFLDNFTSQWVGNNLVFTYIELNPGADPVAVEEKIHKIFLEKGGEEMKAIGVQKRMHLQPIQDIHTSIGYNFDLPGSIDKTFLIVLVTIGVFILLLACVNYINLSTAQAGTRELEVGVRKTMGVTSKGLISQFLGESFIVVFISLIISIGLTYIALPFFNQMINAPISFTPEMYANIAIYLAGFLVFTAVLAGMYPALYLSSFKPSEVLKGRNRDKGGAAFLRKILVVFQFVISIVLISSIIIVSKQVEFIKSKDLGFDASTKLIVPLQTDEAVQQYPVLKKEFAKNSAVSSISGADAVPGMPIVNDILLYKSGETMDNAIHIYNDRVDLEYAQVLGVELISGSHFKDYNQDTTLQKIMVNKVAIDQWNFSPEDAIGQRVFFDWQGERYEFEIVGVFDNIHQFSLHEEVDPLLFQLGNGNRYSFMILEANFDNFQNLISDLKTQWDALELNTPFEYFTLNENLQVLYESDYKTFGLIKYFALISVIISGLGLYAISMFTAERRFKEIGIRKAMGASVSEILVMVSGDLSKLIVIAFIISVPFTIFSMNKWLETFAYRITPGFDTYILAGFVSIAIGWFAISYQSIRAAMTNPVNALKDE